MLPNVVCKFVWVNTQKDQNLRFGNWVEFSFVRKMIIKKRSIEI